MMVDFMQGLRAKDTADPSYVQVVEEQRDEAQAEVRRLTAVLETERETITSQIGALQIVERQLVELKRQFENSEGTRMRMAQEAMDLRESLRLQGAAVQQARQELFTFKAEITVAAHEEADERAWCDEFDDWMEKNGLDRREREHEFTQTVTVTITRDVTISTTDSKKTARGSLEDTEAARDWLDGLIGSEVGDITVDDVSVEDA